MIILDATTKSLQLKLSATITTNQLPFAASFVDLTSTGTTTPSEQDGVSNSTTAVTVVSSPASSTQRLVKSIIIQNADTASAKVTVIYNNNATLRNIIVATLAVGDQLIYEDGNGWSTIDTNGNLKTSGGGGGGSGVSSLNSLTGALSIVAGANVTVTPSGSNITIAASGSGGGGVTVLSSFKNLKAVWASNTTATITADQLVLETSGGSAYLATSVNVTLNSATSGAGGLDTGTLASATWYFIYVIYNGTTVNALMSASATSPTLPSGYTYVTTAISAVRTSPSATSFIGFIQYGRDWQYVIGNNLSVLPQMITGASGSISNPPTWTSVAWANYAPSNVAKLKLLLACSYNGGIIAMAAPNSNYGYASSSTNPPPLMVGTYPNEMMANIVGEFLPESSNVYYAASTGTDSVLAMFGFTLNI